MQNSGSQNINATKLIVQNLSIPRKKGIYFNFPDPSIKNQDFESANEVMDRLNNLAASQLLLRIGNKWVKSYYPRIRCKFCDAYLLLVKMEDRLRIQRLKINHFHKLGNKNTDQLLVLQYMKEYGDLELDILVQYLQQQYKITRERVNYILNKIKKDVCVQQNLKDFLKKSSYQFLQSKKQNHNIILITNQSMKNHYQSDSNIIYYDIFHLIISYNNHNYKFITFSTLNSSNQPILLALIFSTFQTSPISILYFFIQNFHKIPKIIITSQPQLLHNENKQILRRSDEFKQTMILLDVEVLIGQVLKQCKYKNRQKIGSDLKQILMCKQSQKGMEKLIKFNMQYQEIIKNWKYLEQLFNNIDYYMYCNLPNICIALQIISNKSKISNIFAFKSQFYSLHHFMIKLHPIIYSKQFQPNNLIQTIKYQQLFQDLHIKQVRLNIHKTIFPYFLANYLQSQPMYIQHQSIILNINDSTQQYIQSNKCSCKYLQKSGMPCSHLIAYARFKKLNYLNLINDKWILDKKNKGQTKRGPARKSRRNRIL